MKHIILCLAILLFAMMPSSLFARMPDDPYASQWGYEHIGVYEAWDYSTGSDDVIVAIIDNGFDTFHPDLRDNVWKNIDEIPDNNIDDDNNGYVDDVYGWNFLDDTNNPRPDVEHLSASELTQGIFHHGTVVAGIIGARGNNGRDGVGINWQVRLMNLKVLGNSGTGDLTPLVDAIYYAVDNGANVVNISMVGGSNLPDLSTAIRYAYDHNVVVVAAAGNNMTDLNLNPKYPVCSDKTSRSNEVIGVSAMNEDHYLATFSNYGSDCIDITAPGVGIQSTLRYSPTNDLTDSYSTSIAWSGTSFSAPFVSGAAALLKAMAPGFSAEKIISILSSTTHHTPAQDENLYANTYGKGLLQIQTAVKSAEIELKNNTTSDINNIIKNEPVIQENSSAERLLFVSKDTGLYEFRQSGKQTSRALYRATFLNILDIQDFITDDGFTGFVALYGSNQEKSLYIYDNHMRLVDYFPIASFLSGDIAVGDVDGDGSQDFIIVTKNSDNSVSLFIYNRDATRIGEDHMLDMKDAFVSVDVIYDDIRDVYDIAFMYTHDGYTTVERLDNKFFIVDSFDMASIIGGEIMVYDIDHDGREEYIVATAPDHQAMIYVYEQDIVDQHMTAVYSFRAYPPQMKSGVDMTVFDYDNDGKKELIITSRAGASPARIMNTQGDVLEAWWPFDDETIGRVFALGL